MKVVTIWGEGGGEGGSRGWGEGNGGGGEGGGEGGGGEQAHRDSQKAMASAVGERPASTASCA